MSAINEFLLKHNLRIAQNPCVSPDFCLDWPALQADLKAGKACEYAKSRFGTKAGEFTLWENAVGDCAWKLHAAGSPLADGVAIGDATFFPATFANLLTLKNLIQEHDAGSTIFPTAGAKLGRSTLGVGARQLGQAGGDDLQAGLLETGDDLADHVLGDGVGLDDREGALNGHKGLRKLISDGFLVNCLVGLCACRCRAWMPPFGATSSAIAPLARRRSETNGCLGPP